MEEKIILAIIGILGGAIGSMFAPWANWGIEKRKQKLGYRKELIAKWREMLAEAARQDIGSGKKTEKLLAFLEKHKVFYSLSSHLPADKNSYEAYYKRHASLSVPVYLRYLTDEIARIEKEWDLV